MKLFVCEIKFGGEWKALFLVKGRFRDVTREFSEYAEFNGYAVNEFRTRRVKSQVEKDQYANLSMFGGNVEPFEWVN